MGNRRQFIKKSIFASSILFGSNFISNAGIKSPEVKSQNRKFEMLVLGDSIMWGQGLHDNQKFYTIVKEWLQDKVFQEKRETSKPLVEAHSGATIFPEITPRGISTKKYISGETNVSNPSILYQVENALDHYKSVSIPRQNIDLILVNGGINDFSAERLFKIKISEEIITNFAKEYCYYGMKLLLKSIAFSFPNAKIIVTGYYPIISELTDHLMVAKLLWGIFGINPPNLWLDIPFSQKHKIRDVLARRSAVWSQESNSNLQRAVNSFNGQYADIDSDGKEFQRAFFVSPKFNKENSYAAGKKTYLWSIGENMRTNDSMFDAREISCRADGKQRTDRFVCERAGAAHPNVDGAIAYSKEIIDKLKNEIIPISNWI